MPSTSTTSESVRGLDINARPTALKNEIEAAYALYKDDPQSDWGFNGTSEMYSISGIKEYPIIMDIIKRRLSQGQTTFYLMDVGAGLFHWGRSLGSYLEVQLASLEYQDIHVHIVGVSGEQHRDDVPKPNKQKKNLQMDLNQCKKIKAEIIKRDRILANSLLRENMEQRTPITRVLSGKRCTVYELGNIKIEYLTIVLPSRLAACGMPMTNLDLANTFDFIFSDYCLMHLKDGPGALIQLINMLKEHGFIFAQGFRARIEGIDESNLSDALGYILNNLGMPFVLLPNSALSIPSCVLKKAGSGPVVLPLSYAADGHRFDFQPLPSWKNPWFYRHPYGNYAVRTVNKPGFLLWYSLLPYLGKYELERFVEDNECFFKRYRIPLPCLSPMASTPEIKQAIVANLTFYNRSTSPGSVASPCTDQATKSNLPSRSFYDNQEDTSVSKRRNAIPYAYVSPLTNRQSCSLGYEAESLKQHNQDPIPYCRTPNI